MERAAIRKGIILFAVAVACRGPLFAGPVGPVPLNQDQVILNQGAAQSGKTFDVPGATITALTSNTIKAQTITVDGVTISTQPFPPAYSVYPATSPVTVPGITSTFGTFTGLMNGTTITITGQFNGATIHGSSCVITGTITGSNISGTNRGDVSIGTGSGLSITGQVLSMATASSVSTGSLNASDYTTFNGKLSPTGNGSGLTGMTKSQVGLGNVANVDQANANNITSGTVAPARLGSGTPSSSNFLRGDSSYAAVTSTNVGLGQVLNAAQVKRSEYTQKGGFLVGIGTGGIYSILAPGTNGQIISADSTQPTGLKYIMNPTAFTVYPATGVPGFPHGYSASSGTITGDLAIYGGLSVVGNGTFGGDLLSANLAGTNTGDVTLTTSTANGLYLAFSQQLNLSTASSNQTGALTSADWQRFNTATSTSAVSFSNVTITSGTATAFNLQTGTLGPTVVASTLAVGAVTPSVVASGTYSAITLPAANVAAGNLGASVVTSSAAAGSIQDAAIVAVSASKLTGTGTLPNAVVDKSSITAQGNAFNAANKLLMLDSGGLVPSANMPASITSSTGTFGVLSSSSIAINILSFGGRGDALTDNTTAFNLAMAYAVANSPYAQSEIHFPRGVYKGAFNVGNNDISISGEPGATFFIPVSTSAFVVNYTGAGVTDWRYVKDIYFYSGGGGQQGRGIYLNALGFMSITGCQFRSLEYGYYSNSTEWIHHDDNYFVNCKYSAILTTKNGDVLGNNPTSSQNSSAQWFHNVHWASVNVALYVDDPDNDVGDHQAALSLKQCTITQSTVGVVAIFPKNSSALLYYPLSLDYVWLEANGGALLNGARQTQTFNGNTFSDAGLNVSGAEVDLDHITFSFDQLTLSNTAKLIGNTVKFNSTSITVSTDVVGYINNAQTDDQNGVQLSWCDVDNLDFFTADRPALAMTHHHAAPSFAGTYRNKIDSINNSATCALGVLPTGVSGSPTISFASGDGFFANTAVKIVGVAGDAVRWQTTSLSTSSYYVTTFSVRTDSNTALISSFTITDNLGIIVPNGKAIQVTKNWRTYGAMGQPGTAGNVSLDFTLATATTLYVSEIQVVEFATRQEAKEFYNSNTFVVPTSEANNRQFQSRTPPTSGTWVAGDVVWNSAPSSSTPTGYVCVSSGTPGSWANFGTPITQSNLVQGTILADNATSGYIGEFVSTRTTTPVAIGASATFQNFISTGITAGDWGCHGVLQFDPSTAVNGANWIAAISINSGNTTTDHVSGYNSINENGFVAVGNSPVYIPYYRISTASSQTVYLKGRASFTGGGANFDSGSLECVRQR